MNLTDIWQNTLDEGSALHKNQDNTNAGKKQKNPCLEFDLNP
jgi:hypothetical protein